MADVVDDDTLQAVLLKWQTDNTNLPTLVTALPETGRLKSPQTGPVYAEMNCEFARREPAGTGWKGQPVPWYDDRKVTLALRGLRADVVKAVGFASTLFNTITTLQYPSGAVFIRWWPIKGNTLVQDPKVKSGKDIWIGAIEAEVRSVRTGC